MYSTWQTSRDCLFGGSRIRGRQELRLFTGFQALDACTGQSEGADIAGMLQHFADIAGLDEAVAVRVGDRALHGPLGDMLQRGEFRARQRCLALR